MYRYLFRDKLCPHNPHTTMHCGLREVTSVLVNLACILKNKKKQLGIKTIDHAHEQTIPQTALMLSLHCCWSRVLPYNHKMFDGEASCISLCHNPFTARTHKYCQTARKIGYLWAHAAGPPEDPCFLLVPFTLWLSEVIFVVRNHRDKNSYQQLKGSYPCMFTQVTSCWVMNQYDCFSNVTHDH